MPEKKTSKPKSKPVSAKPAKAPSAQKPIGEVFSFFSHISVAAIKLNSIVKKGDKIQIKGHTTDFKQAVDSMQIDGKPVAQAGAGSEIGIKVKDRVRPGDKIYKA
jgi:putative protease